MMRSLFSAVSGLKAHQTKMDVIGNNIANVNTVAYKSQSVTFSDVYYQTTQTASGPSSDGSKGGTNAKQIGLGSTVAAVSTAISSQGATERTDNAWDICISGDAFFVVDNAGSTYFTRSGDFKIDTNGALVTSGGNNVMGWLADDNGNIVKDKVQALYPQSEDYTYTAPVRTTGVSITGNIDAKSDDATKTTIDFYDSLGNRYQATLSVTPDESTVGTQTVKYNIKCDTITRNGEKTNLTFTVDTSGTSQQLSFDGTTGKAIAGSGNTTGNTATSLTGSNKQINLKFAVDSTVKDADVELTADEVTNNIGIEGIITLNGSGMTRYSGTTDLKNSMGIDDTDLDGNPLTDSEGNAYKAGKAVGTMTSLGVDDKGCIVASYSNGDTATIAQIAVATFTNPAGLEKVGENMYAATLNSGEFNGIGVAIDSTGGKMSSGYLEMSNVDLSNEFTSMITTQRGFQANSRIITVSDTMLEELINLKR